jgi:tetratricopeptide (TPR) repeat protein
MLHYDEQATKPVGVSAGMIRQLASQGPAPVVNLVTNNRAVVIGDPKLSDARQGAQLPQALEEAREVSDVLTKSNYNTTTLLNATFSDIFKHLCTDFRILHVASHGVVNFPSKQGDGCPPLTCEDASKEQLLTGILLSHKGQDLVLTPDVIAALSSVPEVVFINCCHLGRVDPVRERYFASRYELAANIGTAFIRKGARAVVVAGWAVNDAAARVFAKEFYEAMLEKKATYGEAVRAAREACFSEFSASNTWGAYQCYGDPYFRLQRNGDASSGEEKLVLAKQALIKLETWLNKVTSYNDLRAYSKSKKALEDELKALAQRIERDGFGTDGGVVEQLAFCYSEIGMLQEAIDTFRALFEMEGAVFTSRARIEHKRLEAIVQARENAANLQSSKRSAANPLAKLDKMKEYVEYLGQKPETFDYCLLRAEAELVVAIAAMSRAYMTSAASHYRCGFEKCQDAPPAKKLRALCLWCLTSLLGATDEQGVKDALQVLEKEKAIEHMRQAWSALEGNARRNSRRLLSDRILLAECRLVLAWLRKQSGEDEASRKALRKDMVERIRKDYRNLLKVSGSPMTRLRWMANADCLLLFEPAWSPFKLDEYREQVLELHRFFSEMV